VALETASAAGVINIPLARSDEADMKTAPPESGAVAGI
jgi:hypothetical protein